MVVFLAFRYVALALVWALALALALALGVVALALAVGVVALLTSLVKTVSNKVVGHSFARLSIHAKMIGVEVPFA